eukprot:TRINITY_DN33834_c0_g2_i1.p2 TRINITY_DN33834_c0_g2~~TRINITY_DN33834_c0_g2_i1.p2  ORF type:complete len:199 (-),score=-7.00 TRINITY_DN33834_c0_g2_i1:53-649(-)
MFSFQKNISQCQSGWQNFQRLQNRRGTKHSIRSFIAYSVKSGFTQPAGVSRIKRNFPASLLFAFYIGINNCLNIFSSQCCVKLTRGSAAFTKLGGEAKTLGIIYLTAHGRFKENVLPQQILQKFAKKGAQLSDKISLSVQNYLGTNIISKDYKKFTYLKNCQSFQEIQTLQKIQLIVCARKIWELITCSKSHLVETLI